MPDNIFDTIMVNILEDDMPRVKLDSANAIITILTLCHPEIYEAEIGALNLSDKLRVHRGERL